MKTDIEKEIKLILLKIKATKEMYRNGKWYHADRKLQGIYDKIYSLIKDIEESNNNENVSDIENTNCDKSSCCCNKNSE